MANSCPKEVFFYKFCENFGKSSKNYFRQKNLPKQFELNVYQILLPAVSSVAIYVFCHPFPAATLAELESSHYFAA